MKERKYFKHTESGEIYFEGLDQKRKINLINCNTGSEYYLPGQYGEHDFFPFEQIPAPSTPVDEVKDKHTALISQAPAMREALISCYRCLTMDSDMEEDFAPEIKEIVTILDKIGW